MDHRVENHTDHRVDHRVDHRLESEKDHLTLQVSVLMDQIDAQADKIRDLEKSLSERRAAMTAMCNGDTNVSNSESCRWSCMVGFCYAWMVSVCCVVSPISCTDFYFYFFIF